MKRQRSLMLIITAAVIFELIAIGQYYYTRGLLYDELENRSESELDTKEEIIWNTLDDVEDTMKEHLWDLQCNLSHPDSMFAATCRLILNNKKVVGGCLGFQPYYYPEKGRLFEPYAYKTARGIKVEQIGAFDHDYTKNPVFIKVVEEKQGIWSDPYVYNDGHTVQHLSTYSFPIFDNDNNLAAVSGIDVDLSWLNDTLNIKHFHPSTFVLLLTQKGKVIGESTATAYDHRDDMERIVSLINDSTVERRPSRGDTTNQVIEYYDESDGDKVIIYYTSIGKSPNWQIALVNYDDEVFEPVYKMRLYNMLLLLFGLAILAFIIHRYLKNERRLRQASVEQARIGSELRVAQNIQNEMLPKGDSSIVNRQDIDIFGTLTSAREVGGDLYDYFVRDEKLFFCIGDVSGKGVPSAMVMAVMTSLFRLVASRSSDPARIVQALNESVCRNNESSMFVTLFVGVLDLPTGMLHYCNAGHDKPILIGNSLEQLPALANLPVGAFDDFVFTSQDYQLKGEATLFLYTDGLTEAKNANRQQFRLQRVMNVLEGVVREKQPLTAVALVHIVSDAVAAFVEQAEQSDDLTLLAIRYLPVKETDRFNESVSLKNNIREVPVLNRFVKDIAGRLSLDRKQSRNLQLAVEEAVVNVMNYAYPKGVEGAIIITAKANAERLKVVVTDEGVPFDPTVKETADPTLSAEERSIGGLGILLMRGLVDSINYERVGEKNVLTLKKSITN